MTETTQLQKAAHDKITWQLYTDCVNAGSRAAQYAQTVARTEAKLNSPNARIRSSVAHINIDSLREELAKYQATEAAAKLALDTHEESYTGWARFWCVPNGHIHSSRHCSTCNKNGNPTAFFLAHDVSGMDEAATVAAQGPVLCTVCFPSAPVDWTNGLDEAAKAKKAAQCPGSGTYIDRSLPHRTGYVYGNWATCPHCGDRPALTSTGKLRAHKPKEK